MASPCSPLDERLSCSQLWAHPSSPGARGLQAPQQHHEPGQMDRGPSTRGAKKENQGGEELGGRLSPLIHSPRSMSVLVAAPFQASLLPGWLVPILVGSRREG